MYRIGEIAKETNMSKRTIDYYTQIGLLNPVRTERNYRLYSEESIHVLELVERYKHLNMPLEEIKTSIEILKSENSVDDQKLEKHIEQIGMIMQHLGEEIKDIEPMLEKLDHDQREILVKKLSAQGQSLAQTLLLLFN